MNWEKLKVLISKFIPIRVLELKRKLKVRRAQHNKACFIRAHGGLFTASELRSCLSDLGITRGKSIIVQSSFNSFKTFLGSADEILEVLRDLVGDDGTICMPTFPRNFGRGDDVFNVKTKPSGSGLLTELFRRMPGSRRSLQPTHTVSALGPLADYFTCEHHIDPYPFGAKSAWTRIARTEGLIVGLGLPAGWTTVWHAVEDNLIPNFPVELYYPEPRIFKVRDYDGSLREIPSFVHLPKKAVHSRFLDELPDGVHRLCVFYGVTLFVLEARPFLDTMIEIARGGRTIYD